MLYATHGLQYIDAIALSQIDVEQCVMTLDVFEQF